MKRVHTNQSMAVAIFQFCCRRVPQFLQNLSSALINFLPHSVQNGANFAGITSSSSILIGKFPFSSIWPLVPTSIAAWVLMQLLTFSTITQFSSHCLVESVGSTPKMAATGDIFDSSEFLRAAMVRVIIKLERVRIFSSLFFDNATPWRIFLWHKRAWCCVYVLPQYSHSSRIPSCTILLCWYSPLGQAKFLGHRPHWCLFLED